MSPPAPEPLLYAVDDDGIATITFNRPERLNALSLAFQTGLRALCAGIHDDRRVRAVVLTGAGRAFCAGADLTGGMFEDDGTGRSAGNRTADAMHALSNPLIADLRALPVPVVSAVNGPAAGAGVGIALAADIVIAARSAYFYLPFMPKLGIVPDMGASWFMQRLAGSGRAAALTLLGDRLSAEQAVQWGVAWACVDDAALAAEARALALRLAQLPAHAALETRRCFDNAALNTLEQQMRHEAERQRELLDKPEFAEGVAAFAQKRAPRFPSR